MKNNIVYFEEIDSTNAEAKRMARAGAGHGLVVAAEKQTAGRGRRGRDWESPAGKNLYFSVLLRPEFLPETAPMLTLVMAYSAAKTITRNEGLAVQIKWPNDLVVSGKKICGILTEMNVAQAAIDYVVIGIGVNVNMTDFPEDLKEKATSLCLEKGKEIEREVLLEEIVQEFMEQYARFEEAEDLAFLQEEYNQMLVNKDREVKVLESDGEYQAHALGINQKGELIVKRDDGRVETVFAGEVSVRGIYGYV